MEFKTKMKHFIIPHDVDMRLQQRDWHWVKQTFPRRTMGMRSGITIIGSVLTIIGILLRFILQSYYTKSGFQLVDTYQATSCVHAQQLPTSMQGQTELLHSFVTLPPNSFGLACMLIGAFIACVMERMPVIAS
jgi:hypothetical protein